MREGHGCLLVGEQGVREGHRGVSWLGTESEKGLAAKAPGRAKSKQRSTGHQLFVQDDIWTSIHNQLMGISLVDFSSMLLVFSFAVQAGFFFLRKIIREMWYQINT